MERLNGAVPVGMVARTEMADMAPAACRKRGKAHIPGGDIRIPEILRLLVISEEGGKYQPTQTMACVEVNNGKNPVIPRNSNHTDSRLTADCLPRRSASTS